MTHQTFGQLLLPNCTPVQQEDEYFLKQVSDMFAAESDDDSFDMQELNQAYNNLTITDFVDLDQASAQASDIDAILADADFSSLDDFLNLDLQQPAENRKEAKRSEVVEPVVEQFLEDQANVANPQVNQQVDVVTPTSADFSSLNEFLDLDLQQPAENRKEAKRSEVVEPVVEQFLEDQANVAEPQVNQQASVVTSASEHTTKKRKRESRKRKKSKRESRKRKKSKKSKRESRKRKAGALTLGEERQTKWRRGMNDSKMKRGIRQVRLKRRKIRVVAEEEGLNERALRRYVHISMDPRKQNSGYYIPLQAEEKVPKCLRGVMKMSSF